MPLVILRLIFILVSLIYLSEIPSAEKVFFNARFAFNAMLFIDAINLFKANEGFEKYYAAFGIGILGLITFIDWLGVMDIIVLHAGKIGPSEKFTLLHWVPSITVDKYIQTFSFFTLFFSAAELVLIFFRNKSRNKVASKGTVLDT
ncbi:hypothetical protein [Neobacillus massiliamazoniensis]|uniref:Uncharacterized protein n=1 Tax=Neobacillus massiliamazoniensis TaxID=1499688 RepID=A0A0U1NQJ5_9BACI|nr:hypothetical protein [Neobacillus massiliamazoniensis]CRK80323.1 hypothetical protein BN000_00204 [Neobacillus massiliamazoniensis]